MHDGQKLILIVVTCYVLLYVLLMLILRIKVLQLLINILLGPTTTYIVLTFAIKIVEMIQISS